MNISKLFDGKKIDVIGLVNTVENMSQRLDALKKGQAEIKELLSAAVVRESEIPPTSNAEVKKVAEQLIEVVGMQAPWVIDGFVWDGKSEVYDEEELKAFLGFNPNGNDPDGKSWCAGFWLSILGQLGIDTTGLDLSALSFSNLGYEVEPVDGDYPDGVFMVFQPKPGSKYQISHVGVKVDGDKLFGGNQGDSAKRSNLAWYLANAILVAVRCPNGYKLSGNTKKK